MAAFSVAPAVSYSERDTTLYTKSNVVLRNGLVGIFDWGPIEDGVDIDGGKTELKNVFGKPTANLYLDHLIAIDYLRYSSALNVMRVEGDAARNASSEGYGTTIMVKNESHFKANEGSIKKDGCHFMARYAGNLGNNLIVSVADSTTFDTWEFNDAVSYTPETGEYAVVVVDTSGSITGFSGAYGARLRYTLSGKAESAGNLSYEGYGAIAYAADMTAAQVVAAHVAALPDSASASYRQTLTGQQQIETLEVTSVGDTDATIINSTGSALALTLHLDGVATPVVSTIGDGATTTVSAVMQTFVDNFNAQYAWAGAELTTDETAGVYTITYNREGNYSADVATIEQTGDLSPYLTIGAASITQTAIEDEYTVTYTAQDGISADVFVVDTAADGLVLSNLTIISQGSTGDVITGESYDLMQMVSGAKKGDGSSAYFPTIVNEGSNWIYFVGTELVAGNYPLTGGATDHANANRVSGYNAYADTTKYKIKGLIDSCNSVLETQTLIDVASTRRDCVGIWGPTLDTIQNNIGSEKESIIQYAGDVARTTSYQFAVDNWARVWDEDNDVYRWIPCTGGTAGKRVYNMQNVGSWQSFSYYNRGKFSNWNKLAWSANDTQRGDLYKKAINSIVFDSSEGFVLLGTKTGLTRPSAFDRINVRDLFIMMEQDISATAKYTMGELNDEYTQRLFRNTVRPYMRNLKDSRAFSDFKIKADGDNNTTSVVQNNQFIAGIWVKPSKVIDWIWLDFAAVDADMSFDEVEGAAGIAM